MSESDKPFDKIRRKLVTARIGFLAQLAAFDKEDFARSPAEGEWSALQVAHHLYIADGLFLEQLKRIQDEDNPTLIAVGEEAPRQTQHSEPPTTLEGVLSGLTARREELFEYLLQVPDAAWERPYIQPNYGPRKFYQFVNVIPMHEQMHTQQLADIKHGLEG